MLLDTTYALRGPSGTGVYLTHLVPALERLGCEVVEAANADRRTGGRASPGGWRSALNLLEDVRWTQTELPRRARAAEADVLHHPLPAVAPLCPVAQAITVHDLAFERFPEHFDPRFRRFAQLTHKAAARRAGAVITPTQATADDVVARWEVPRARVVVARHGPGQEPEHRRRRTPSPRHFLYVGDDEPRKNLGLLLAGYAQYRAAMQTPLPLVLAGRVASSGAPGVTVVARPDAEALGRLYAEAAALVHPSLHEGFGLTPLEAMSAGTPVLAARSAAVEEVCGDAALYVGPHEARGLAERLASLSLDGDLRRDLTERGRRRAAEFSWARSARAHLDAYALAISGERSR